MENVKQSIIAITKSQKKKSFFSKIQFNSKSITSCELWHAFLLIGSVCQNTPGYSHPLKSDDNRGDLGCHRTNRHW